MGEGIITGLIVAAIAGVAGIVGRWAWTHHEALLTGARQGVCQHEWEPINQPNDPLPMISPSGDEWCVKCDKRRWSGSG